MTKYGLGAILVLACLSCDDDPTASQAGDLPPDTFVNGSEGQVWWPSPFTSYYTHTQGQFRAGTAWMNFVDDQRVQDGSRVEIDYLKMYARVNGIDSLVSFDEYSDGVVGGGFYLRSRGLAVISGEQMQVVPPSQTAS